MGLAYNHPNQDIRMREAQTRAEIMKQWNRQSFNGLNMFCCPDCRDILHMWHDSLTCVNQECCNMQAYDPKTGVEL